jgi:hypothetical protein
MAMHNKFGVSSILVRFALAYGVSFSIYNPSGYSYVHWLFSWNGYGSFVELITALVLKLATGLLLLIICSVMASVIYNAMGRVAILVVSLFSLSVTAIIWFAGKDLWGIEGTILVGIGLFVSIGLVYSGIRHRLSGQVQHGTINTGPGF